MAPGDLYWADLPDMAGREQHGYRPVLILQDDGYAARLPTMLVVPLTKTRAAAGFPGSVVIPATTANGLTYDSVALVSQTRACDRTRFGVLIGVVEPAVLTQVYAILDRLTGRP